LALNQASEDRGGPQWNVEKYRTVLRDVNQKMVIIYKKEIL